MTSNNLPTSVDDILVDIKSKFKTAREQLDKKSFPFDLMKDFSDFLGWIEQDPLTTVYANPELKKFFFEEFVGGLAKRLSLIRECEEHVSAFY